MKSRPNLVFIFSDQQHWRAVGYRDPFFLTPNLDEIAAESVVVENAFCSCPQCSPSRSSILTGLYPSRTGVLGNIESVGGNPLRRESIGLRLQQAGYHTAYFGKWHLGKDPVGTAGWDTNFGVTGADTTNDVEVTRRAIEFLSRRVIDPTTPFALFLSYNDPHGIYAWQQATQTFSDALPLPASCRPDALDGKPPPQRQFMSEDQGRIMRDAPRSAWQKYRACYREKVRNFDAHVGRVLKTLRQTRLLDRSLLVVTSDHGDMDTHHGLIFKGPFMYEQMVRVPLTIRLPQQLGGVQARIDRVNLTVNVDWAPTLLEVAGVDPVECDGLSLLPTLLDRAVSLPRSFVIAEYYGKQKWLNPIRMIRTSSHKLNRYIRWGSELYDLKKDPDELRNAIDDPACSVVRQQLDSELDDWMNRRGDPFPLQYATTRDGTPLP